MPENLKGMGQKKCSLWSSRLEVGRGTNDPIPEKCAVTKPPKSHGGGQDPHRFVALGKSEKNKQIL
jgi:hypothetical protein